MRKKLIFIFLLLGICSNCYSAETTYYVDVDVIGGDADGSSLANAYSSLNIAENARNADITAGNAVRFLCHNTLGGTDSTFLAIAGWITDADSYLKIEAAAAYRHAGVWDATKYHLATTDNYLFETAEDYIRFNGLQLSMIITANNQKSLLYINTLNASNEIRISNTIIKGSGTGTGGMRGIEVSDTDAVVKMWNCVVYGFLSDSDPADISFMGMLIAQSVSVDIWNCTISGCRTGIYSLAGTVNIINVLSFNNTDDFNGGTIDYCCTDDGDGTNGQTIGAAPDQSGDNYAALVVDEAGRDYHITDASSKLVGNGTDDPGGAIQDDTDIAGTARTSTWDIGAFELAAPAPTGGQVIMITSLSTDKYSAKRNESTGGRISTSLIC